MSFHTPIIYVVDDDSKILQSTYALLEENEWNIVCLSCAARFLDVYRPEQPGCLVLDLQMPNISGLELQQTLIDWHMDIPIVFISGDRSIENAVTALKAGAHDFLEKPFTQEVLIEAVKTALKTQAAQRDEKAKLETVNRRFGDLTEREWEVLNSMVSGPSILSSKEIARELNISHRTVEHHRSRIMVKTQSPSLPDLIRLASFIGLASPSFPTAP